MHGIVSHTYRPVRLFQTEVAWFCAALGCRFDSSLGLLTKKFVKLVEEAPGGVLDLNKAAESLLVRLRSSSQFLNPCQ